MFCEDKISGIPKFEINFDSQNESLEEDSSSFTIYSSSSNPSPASSIVEDEHFFEGAEKLLEIWFHKVDSTSSGSLRSVPHFELVNMLQIAKCHILHMKSNEYLDSYILSESSMFVSDNRIILKTCGETRLLHVIDVILHLAKQYANLTEIANIFYSRKNFLRPERQPYPHHSFEDEIEYLNKYFKDGDGFTMGYSFPDKWFLYTLKEPEYTIHHPDHTLEILMSHLPDEISNAFTSLSKNGRNLTLDANIAQILPVGAAVHEELFEPCGYSMNALMPNSDQYITIHVTPESDFSYVSFETNQNRTCVYRQTLSVLEIFKPGKFMITLFVNKFSENGIRTQRLLWDNEIIGYKCKDRQYISLKNDTVMYALFIRS